MFDDLEALLEQHGVPRDIADKVRGVLLPWYAQSRTTDDLGAQATIRLDDDDAATPPAPLDPDDRYVDRGPLGAGGMGEVRRVFDTRLQRTLAMKTLHTSVRAQAAARFAYEARCLARLEHPGIVPLHDFGVLPDGRPWFTMKEVHGTTFDVTIRRLHEDWSEASLREVVSAFLQVCEAVAFAHERGVLHRDLKPQNIMMGEHGEVLVLDWGLARALDRDADAPQHTRPGVTMGTPAYMPLEQAEGDPDRLGPWTDVYALGAILYQVLAGRPPYQGRTAGEVLALLVSGPPVRLGGDRLPQELVRATEQAMARNAAERLAEVTDLSAMVRAWIERSEVRERALAEVARATACLEEAADLRLRAAALEQIGDTSLRAVPPWAPAESKRPAWRQLDKAAASFHRAELKASEAGMALESALRTDPELSEAHALAAELVLASAVEAEERRDSSGVARATHRLRTHLENLPPDDAIRSRCAAYCAGQSRLTLLTEPPGASVELLAFEEVDRRLVLRSRGSLGRTPVVEVEVPSGSYIARLNHPDGAQVDLPIHLRRAAPWGNIPPGSDTPEAVRLPPPGSVGPDECYVPAGWFVAGGDPGVRHHVPARRVWCDGFVAMRFPVTNGAYLDFLHDLVAEGDTPRAERYIPGDKTATGASTSGYHPSADGGYVLGADADGDVWTPSWPVMAVDRMAAVAFARWMAKRTGLPWRLPMELEWEKMARGVDGRWFPWGDHHDDSFAAGAQSRQDGRQLPHPVDSFPIDTSVYGVRGLAGNAHDWCADRYRKEGPQTDGARVVAGPDPAPEGATGVERALRGGGWAVSPNVCRAAKRDRFLEGVRLGVTGVRLVRSWP